MIAPTHQEVAALALSLSVAWRSVVFSLPPAICIAWVLTRRRFVGMTLLDAVVHLPLVLPPVAVGYVLLLLFGTRGPIGGWLERSFGIVLIFTRNGAALATAVMSFPLMVRAMRISLENVDRGLEDVARTLGARPLDRFMSVTLPLMLPGLLAGAITAFAAALGEFGAVITFVSNIPGETQTLPLALYSALQAPGGEHAASAPRRDVRGVGPWRPAALRMVRTAGALGARPMSLKIALEKRLDSFVLDVEFEAPTPGIVALFGPSGCGKSTTINLIAGLLAPDRGAISLDDDVLLDTRRRIAVAAERRGIGYVFQDARLFPHLNVAANLGYAERRARRAAYVTLERVLGLLELGPLLARRVHQLSGGERQRVAIGRALLSQPRLLLLDEPLAALDRDRREEVLPYLESLRDQLSVPMIYVSHRFDEVLRLATHIVLMQSGKVAAEGGITQMSLDPKLRALIGADDVGSVLDGTVIGDDAASGLTRIRVGNGELKVEAAPLAAGMQMRVQLLARDVIVATRMPQYLSVRNSLPGVITAIDDDATGKAGDVGSDLISIDIGAGASVLARVTRAATRELALAVGAPAWALVKAVSLRGHSFAAPTSPPAPTPPLERNAAI